MKIIAAIEAKYVCCSECGKNTNQLHALSGWKMCEECHRVICSKCLREKLNSASHCKKHSPVGIWVESVLDHNQIVFRK